MKKHEDLQELFAEETIPTPDFDNMWNKIQQSRGKKKVFRFPKKTFLALAASCLILAGTLLDEDSFIADANEKFINKIFGTKEEMKKVDPYAGDAEWAQVEKMMEDAEQKLTQEEFVHFSAIMEQFAVYLKKINRMENGVRIQDMNRLTPEEQEDFKKMTDELQGYFKKIGHE